MRLHRFDQKLICIVLGVLAGWLVLSRLAGQPNVMPAYFGMNVLALVAAIAFVATLRTGRTQASGPPWSFPRPWAVPSRQRAGEIPQAQSVGETYRRRDAIAAYVCWEACWLALSMLNSQLPWIMWVYNMFGVPPTQSSVLYARFLVMLLISVFASMVSVYLYHRLVGRVRFASHAHKPLRLFATTALVWTISCVVLDEVSYQTGLYSKINQWTWDVFGRPDNIYSFYNLGLPQLLAHIGVVAIPSWWLSMITYRLIHRPLQPDQPVCQNCGYNLTGNVSGRCPECGKKVHVERLGT